MLEGKVAFVTGASAGIGAAVARSLAAEGVKLGLASRRGGDLGLPAAAGLTCDVRDIGQVEARRSPRRSSASAASTSSSRTPASARTTRSARSRSSMSRR